MILKGILTFRCSTSNKILVRTQFKKATKTEWKNGHKDIEKKWTSVVGNSFTNLAPTEAQASVGKGEKKYVLSMFPYPSGKLHMGHVRVYSISDAIAKFYHMRGYSVIHPMGWDAFGLPAENAAKERGKDPVDWTRTNISYMKSLLQRLGCSFDWQREISTCDPAYYKWTQYIFTKIFKKGLAYQMESSVNWDPVEQTVLANEQVDEEGKSWRSGATVEKKFLKQWFIKTNRFSDQLITDMDDPSLVNWKRISDLQKFWIGECTGHSVMVDVVGENSSVINQIPLWLSDLTHLGKLGFVGIHPDHQLGANDPTTRVLSCHIREPLSGRLLPLVVSKDLPYNRHLQFYPATVDDSSVSKFDICVPQPKLISNEDENIIEQLKNQNIDVYKSSPQSRDWLISRQRFWGTPIPIVHCPSCGPVCVPEEELPVMLPTSEEGGCAPSLSQHESWKNTSCPKCNGPATRETDTMDTFVDSSWYYLRYLDPTNSEELVRKELAESCLPVDIYIGGQEHAIRHLFHARLVHKILVNEGIAFYKEPFKELLVQGLVKSNAYVVKSTGKYIPADQVDFKAKPLVEKETGKKVQIVPEKMSKSKHNGVDALEILEEHGVDVTRLIVLSSAPPQENIVWTSNAIPEAVGVLYKMWGLVRRFMKVRQGERTGDTEIDDDHRRFLMENRNTAIGKVTSSIHCERDLSTSIYRLKKLMNHMRKVPLTMAWDPEYEKTLRSLIVMLYPFCPHISAEAWNLVEEVSPSSQGEVFEQPWPRMDPEFKRLLVIMVNDRKVDRISVSAEKYDALDLNEAVEMALEDVKVRDVLGNARILKREFEHFKEDTRCILRLYTSSSSLAKKKSTS